MRGTIWILSILLGMMLACTPGPDDVTSPGDDDDVQDDDDDQPIDGYEETEVGDGFPIVALEAGVSEHISTVVTLRWESAEPSTGFITYSVEGQEDRVVHSDGSGTEHRVWLKGLRAQTQVEYRLCIDTAIQGWCSGLRLVETGSLPPELPEMVLSSHDPEGSAGGYTTFSVIGEEAGFPVIVDEEGQYVWFYLGQSDEPSTRAVLSQDRASVLIGRYSLLEENPGSIYRIAYDGSEVLDIPAPDLGLDFTEVEPGSYAYISGETREYDGGRIILGNTLVELDEGGEPRTVWSVFDDFAPDLASEFPPYSPGPGIEPVEEWTHFNGLSYDERTDAYLLTNASPALQMVVCIDRATGELRWVLGSAESDFVEVGADPMIHAPHSAQMLEDGVLVFNRGDFQNGCSRANEIALDLDDWSAETVWEYSSEECIINYLLGHTERLPGGNTVTTFTTAGQIDEVTPDGELVWRVSAVVGTGFGFGGRVEDLY